jgi:hypothetical protein
VETLKNALAILAGIVGFLTAVLTLYAKYLDVKKSAAPESDSVKAATITEPRPEPAPSVSAPDEYRAPVAGLASRPKDPSTVELARRAVKAPATTLIAAGIVSLLFNLFVAGFGYVDQFVTPITTDTKNKRAMIEAVKRGELPITIATPGASDGLSDEATAVLTIVVLMSLSMASLAAVWAGYGMLRLRSYWLSVAGSFAIMAGGCFCCMSGIPIGIWSLSVLYKPEVASSFE